MSLWRHLRRGVRVLTNPSAADQDVADEVRHYLDQATDELMAQGLSPDEARRAVRLEIGTVTVVKEQIRASGWEHVIDTLVADLRYAVRMLVKTPAFTAVAIATLGLGIGANSAIFSVVNGVLLQPLPYPEPERLVRICRAGPDGISDPCRTSMPKFVAWRQSRSFEAVAAHSWNGAPGVNLTGGDRPERIPSMRVSANYFQVFVGAPIRGRTFTDEEDRPGGPRVAVMAHTLWTTRFGSDPNVIGQPIVLNGERYTVVGIAPAGFRSDPQADVFTPLQTDPASIDFANIFQVAARLHRGVSAAAARAELQGIGDAFRRANPRGMFAGETIAVEPMLAFAVRDVRPALLVLLGAVALVLLIACANVANLLLARAASRRKEMAVRAAIGASRGRIVRQVLIESVLLAAIGAAAGVGLGVWGARALLVLSPANLPRAADLERAGFWGSIIDWRMLGFTAGLGVLTGILFGVVPALHLARADLGLALKEGGDHGSSGVGVGRTRGALVIAEMSLAVVLLVGALLLIRSFVALRTFDPGFDRQHVLTLETTLPGAAYSTTAQVAALTRRITERVDALPGVLASAQTIWFPTAVGPDLLFRIEGRPFTGDQWFHGDEQWRCASPKYFQALSIRVERGRTFTERDVAGMPPVAVINTAFSQKYWPNADAIGQRITVDVGLGPDFADGTRQIVGVVADAHETGLDRPAPPVIYVPAAQLYDGLTRWLNNVFPRRWVVQTVSSPFAYAAAVQREFSAVDPELAVARVRALDTAIDDALAAQSFNMLLLTIFATIAVLLAAVGIYGLMSYSVAQRTHEIGVRLAFGAARRDILALVVGRGMRLAASGLLIGVVAALGATRALTRMLFGVGAGDPVTYVAVAVGLAAIAFVACYVPALRAARVDPVIAMRHE